MKNIDVKEFIEALNELEKERGIKKDYLIESLETALVTAYKRNFDSVDNVKVTIDDVTGEIHIYSVRSVVEVSEDPLLEIGIEDAKKIDSNYNIGDVVISISNKAIGYKANKGLLVTDNGYEILTRRDIELDPEDIITK